MLFKKSYATFKPIVRNINVPEGLWIKCDDCNRLIYRKELKMNLSVCPACNYHFPLSAKERLEMLLEENSFIEYDKDLTSNNFLSFEDIKRYEERLKEAQAKTNQKEGIITGEGKLAHHTIAIGVLDFNFMGGSMGLVVGEKISRLFEQAKNKQLPLIIFSSSGGARMQEGTVALMQMAKTACACLLLKDGPLYISVLTHPTTGGVLASFASLADIIIAEQGALIGFAGPRVIEQTIKEPLPNGFQRAEFLTKHGQIDITVHRKNLKNLLIKILDLFYQ